MFRLMYCELHLRLGRGGGTSVAMRRGGFDENGL
jgi:hypothetical protein